MSKHTGPFEPSKENAHALSVDEIELLYCFRLMSEETQGDTLKLIASMIRRPRREPNTKPCLYVVPNNDRNNP